jgi:sensor domain CHASE-containing protein
MLDLLVAPAVEPLEHEQAQHDLDRRAGPPQAQAVRAASGHVGFDPAKDRVILEQPVELRELGLEGLG